MIRNVSSPTRRLPGIPRESGDDPPHEVLSRFIPRVFPARAGMIPPERPPQQGDAGIPRESGDDPGSDEIRLIQLQYSPRERG